MDRGASSGVQEGRIRRSWRLTKIAWDLIRSHREMQALAFLGVLFAVVASVLILYLGGSFEHSRHDRGHLFLVALLSGYTSTVISVFFNVALASAADEAIDGHQMKLREALGEALECLGSILVWSAIALGVGVLLNAIAQRVPWGSWLVARLLGAVWALATIFVVPVLVLEGTGPVTAIRRSGTLLKKRWGETISGSLTIGAWTVVATVPAAVAICAGLSVAPRSAEAGGLLIAGGLVTIIVASVLASAARGVFAVALYRYALDEPTGGFSVGELADPFKGQRPSLSRSRIWGWLAVALCAIVLLGVIGGISRHARMTAPNGPTTSFDATFPRDAAPYVRPGTDVYFLQRVVGHVSEAYPGPDGVLIRIDIAPSFAEAWQQMDPSLRVMRPQEENSATWIAVIPRVAPSPGISQP